MEVSPRCMGYRLSMTQSYSLQEHQQLLYAVRLLCVDFPAIEHQRVMQRSAAIDIEVQSCRGWRGRTYSVLGNWGK
jgi:hypothetical protein